jgi:cysteine desulfurase family protein (TIGR01976 family)
LNQGISNLISIEISMNRAKEWHNSPMTYDVNRTRAHFPSLDSGLAFFDGPGGSQVPEVVGNEIAKAITMASSNRGLITLSERNANDVVLNFRSAVGDLLNADPKGVVYGRSWTQLTYDFSRNLARTWKAGDEVIVSNLDHDSNIRPWIQAAERVGAVIKWAKFDLETGELPVSAITDLLSEKTKLVAVTGASNTLGTRPDIAAIAREVHRTSAYLYVDAVHLTPHSVIDMKALGADFLGFSPYKIMGPHCAALAASPELLESLSSDKLLPSTNDVPERFEFGTLPYELMAGTTAAINFVAQLASPEEGTKRERIVASMNALEEYEESLFEHLETSLLALPKVRSFGHALKRTPTIYFEVSGIPSSEVYRHLATKGVNAPARALGLGDSGAVRAGLAPYSNHDDVERLVAGIAEL